uniref:Uncharacterized protein n=1 Tax=Rhizophora mucronata TaxID=61149 RepID=A0A2P2QSS3_RHIMU
MMGDQTLVRDGLKAEAFMQMGKENQRREEADHVM